MHFRRLTHADLDFIRDLQPEGWPDITDDFRFYISQEFCYPTKVTVNNTIVGIGNAIVFKNSAWLAHIIVRKDNRKSGIGSEIVENLLEYVRSRSADSVSLIATDLGEPVYKKAGFRVVSDYLSFKRDKGWRDDGISQRIEPYEDKFAIDILRLDREISGEARAPLITKYLAGSFVYADGNEVRGFYLPRLGEGPVYAADADAGRELLTVKFLKADKAVVAAENKRAIAFLEENGFVMTGIKGRRMVFGKDVSWQPEKYFSRISGNYG